jgi:hypothetical protein
MEMTYCYEHGLPHSEFQAWAPEDRAKTIAYALEAGQRCPSCGTAPWEWKENRWAYHPEERMCWGCYHKDGARKDARDLPDGTSIVLVPTLPGEGLPWPKK